VFAIATSGCTVLPTLAEEPWVATAPTAQPHRGTLLRALEQSGLHASVLQTQRDLVRARLLLARRRYAEARSTLDEPLIAFLTPIEVTFAAERAEAAARLGDRAGAAAACAFGRLGSRGA